jgi:hypothetical protein
MLQRNLKPHKLPSCWYTNKIGKSLVIKRGTFLGLGFLEWTKDR